MAVLTTLADAAAAAGSATIAVRGSWHLACLGYGNFLAAQQGIIADERQAYDMGRSKLVQGLANGAVEAVKRLDWRIVAACALHVREDLHGARTALWRGLRRDAGRARDFALRRRPFRHETVTLLHEAEAAGQPLVAAHALIGIQNEVKVLADGGVAAQRAELGALVTRGEHRTTDETLRLEYLRKELKAHGARAVADASAPAPTVQGLFAAALATPFLPQVAALAGGVVLLSVTGFAVDEWRIGRIKHDSRQWKADNGALRADLNDRDGRLKTLRVEVTAQNVQCVHAQIEAADVRVKQEARAHAASLSARRRIANADSDARNAFDLDSALAGLRKPAGPARPDAAPGSSGADDLAPGVLPKPVADAGTAAARPALGPGK